VLTKYLVKEVLSYAAGNNREPFCSEIQQQITRALKMFTSRPGAGTFDIQMLQAWQDKECLPSLS
jgi:hypothetical protein